MALRTKVRELTHMDARIVGENPSLKRQLDDNREQDTLHHPPEETLRVEIVDIKNKQEEIKSQQAAFKHETKTHINSWAHVIRGMVKVPSPPLAEIEEVVQANLMEERTRRAQKLNLKVRGLPLPLPSSVPMVIGTSFLMDHLDLQDVALHRAWLGSNSTLFLRFRSAVDQLPALKAKRK
jgi:hypothetical protein